MTLHAAVMVPSRQTLIRRIEWNQSMLPVVHREGSSHSRRRPTHKASAHSLCKEAMSDCPPYHLLERNILLIFFEYVSLSLFDPSPSSN